jgi:hypothetical protein
MIRWAAAPGVTRIPVRQPDGRFGQVQVDAWPDEIVSADFDDDGNILVKLQSGRSFVIEWPHNERHSAMAYNIRSRAELQARP